MASYWNSDEDVCGIRYAPKAKITQRYDSVSGGDSEKDILDDIWA